MDVCYHLSLPPLLISFPLGFEFHLQQIIKIIQCRSRSYKSTGTNLNVQSAVNSIRWCHINIRLHVP